MSDASARHVIFDSKLEDDGTALIKDYFKLDSNGQLMGTPNVEVSGGNEHTQKRMVHAGVPAVRRAAPFTMLPKDKYDAWREVAVNFDASNLTR